MGMGSTISKAEGAGAKLTAISDAASKVTKPLQNLNNYRSTSSAFSNQAGLGTKDKDFKANTGGV